MAACAPTAAVDARFSTTLTGEHFPPVVDSVRLSDLPSACDGQTLTLTVFGNPQGDPGLPGQLVSTVDSAVVPCAHTPVDGGQGVVAGGAITFTLCAAGGPDGTLAVHDITSLAINGIALPVAPTVATLSAAAGPRSSPAPHGFLPLTGMGISLFVTMGVLSVLAGMAVVLGVRRRRNQPR